MSDTTGTPVSPSSGAAPADAETRARLMGWKPEAEYKGDKSKWLPADEFLDRGFASPAVMAERLHFMGDRMARMERDTQAANTQLAEAVGTINTMTTMMRSSERRAYERARAEMEAERTRAVEAGDTATFSRIDTQMRELDKTAPPVQPPPIDTTRPVTTTTTTDGKPEPRRTATNADPAVTAFYARNPWYSRDPNLTMEADILHTGLLNARPDLSIEQNLAEVERRLKGTYPDRFGITPPARTNGADHSGDNNNQRRDEPGAVSPSAGSGGGRREQSRRTFSTMPQESKDAYRRYAKQLEGKGEPLTEAEWATDYWSQFEEIP